MNTATSEMSENENQDTESSESETDMSPDNVAGTADIPVDTILSHQTSVSVYPFIGQRFVSQDAAYEFYCIFAKRCGFSIRRNRTRGKNGVGRGVTRRDFTCHRGGFPQAKSTGEGKSQRNRKSSRCGCKAYMRIVKRADSDVPEWRVTSFTNFHNHELFESAEVHLVPPQLAISNDDKSQICLYAKAGMSVRQMLRLMELEKKVKQGCLPFTELDIKTLLPSIGHVDRDNDPIELISMCKALKDDDPHFKYDFRLGGNNRLEHIAWSYASSAQQYEACGDAVVFDTTHRLDAYDMLLGLWIGVDNHGLPCLFGCVLLRDENIESFTWALKKFVSYMGGKPPQTILTDQNMWLKEAIACELPQTKHAFCIWHIMSKFSEWFSVLLGSHYDDWKAEFYRLYHMDMVEEFDAGWKEMVSRYGLQSNKHIIGLYAMRDFWALSFLRCHFFVGLMCRSLSETINAFIQRILSAQSELDHFIDKVARIAEYCDQAGEKQKMQKVSLKTGSPMESHAATILTPYAFSLLQEELLLAPQFASIMVNEGLFHVRHHTQIGGIYKVTWDPHQNLSKCNCHQFEFMGILCRHILRVLSINNCFQIPEQYLPSRWRLVKPLQDPSLKEQNEKVQNLESLASSIVSESAGTEERLEVACEQMAMVLSHIKQIPRSDDRHTDLGINSHSGSLMLPEVDDADGIVQSFSMESVHGSFLDKLKTRKPTSGIEMGKKRRHSSIPCREPVGHDTSGSITENDGLHGDVDALGFV